MTQLDSEQLRTFLAIAEAGSVSGGAVRIHRSQSATSLQLRHLEETVGKPLFSRHGRGMTLTAAGEHLLPVAQRVTQSLDATLAELREEGLKGRLRIGMTDDHSRAALARAVAVFNSRHSHVELEVHCALGVGFEKALDSGTLDLAVFEVAKPSADDVILRQDSLAWMQSRQRDFSSADILPVALFDRDCWWRETALSGLQEAGRSYRVVFTSESTIGVRAAVHAGIAAALLGTGKDASDLVPVPDIEFRCSSFLVLRQSRGADSDVCEAMREAIKRAF